jgi:hypothetical protein
MNRTIPRGKTYRISGMRDIYEGIAFTAECVQEPDPEYELTEGN